MALTTEDRLALLQLYADYCFAIDDGRAADFAACFTPDGTLEAYGDPVTGTEDLIAFAAGVAGIGMRHQVTNLAFAGDGDEATGRAYLYVYRAGPDGHEVLLTGRYVDTLKKEEDAWRFVRRVMTADTPA